MLALEGSTQSAILWQLCVVRMPAMLANQLLGLLSTA